MSVSLQEQISTLFSCLAMGLGVGLLYDLLRLVRLTLPRRTLQEILDLLFWLGACGMLFFCGIVFGNGRVPAVHGPVPAAGGNGLFSSAQPLDPAGAGHPGPAAARFLGWVTRPSGGLFVFSRLRWQKF